ncbi:hypothetical protein TNCV_324941 [Trichonephila clavipes]|nr:hypothetical protein TNCV_324941 [Trichonephila clavipes]
MAFNATANDKRHLALHQDVFRGPRSGLCRSDWNGTMIQKLFLPTLQKKDLDKEWLQQDGTTSHTSRVSMGVLRAAFPE